MLVRLLYVSRAIDKDCAKSMESILETSRAHNLQHGITGVLCYGCGIFLQGIEGGRDAVNTLYNHIVFDKRPVLRRMDRQTSSNWLPMIWKSPVP